MIKVIAFDLWDTLAYRRHVTKLLENISNMSHHEVLRIYEDIYCKLPNDDYDALLDKLIIKLKLNLSTKEKEKFKHIIEDRSDSGKLFSDVLPVISKIKKKYKVVLISNSTHYADKLLKRTKLNKKFDHIFLSYKIGMLKPSKKIYEFVLKTMKVKPDEMLMIGNTYIDDVKAARSCKINAILLDRKNKYKDKIKIKNLKQLEMMLK